MKTHTAQTTKIYSHNWKNEITQYSELELIAHELFLSFSTGSLQPSFVSVANKAPENTNMRGIEYSDRWVIPTIPFVFVSYVALTSTLISVFPTSWIEQNSFVHNSSPIRSYFFPFVAVDFYFQNCLHQFFKPPTIEQRFLKFTVRVTCNLSHLIIRNFAKVYSINFS